MQQAGVYCGEGPRACRQSNHEIGARGSVEDIGSAGDRDAVFWTSSVICFTVLRLSMVPSDQLRTKCSEFFSECIIIAWRSLKLKDYLSGSPDSSISTRMIVGMHPKKSLKPDG